MKPFPTYSIIIPTYNRSDLADQVLQDVMANLEPDTEVILVDDGSTDDTQAVVGKYPYVTYVRHEENRGVSPAWNTGIRAAKGEYLAIINNDIRIKDPLWCSKLVDPIKGRKAISGVESVTRNSATSYKGQPVHYLNGWMYAFPRRIFSELGLFEEAFAPASFEDVEFCTRAKFGGYELKTVKGIMAQHSYAQTVNTVLKDKIAYLNTRNREIWLKKLVELDKPRLRIVIDCPSNGRKWKSDSLEKEGLGGAETAVTLMSRELVSRGHEVLIFNDFYHPSNGDHDSSKNDVIYYNRKDIPSAGLESDAFIAFRCPSEYIQASSAPVKLFWSCDQQTTPPATWDANLFPYVDKTVCISAFHEQFIRARHGDPSTEVIGCSINSWDYEPHPSKNPAQFLFCSVPHRGLEYMPVVMSEIRRELPEAELYITSDYRLWGADGPRNQEFRANPLLSREHFLGMVDRSELVKLQLESMAQPYPCTYEELFCVAVAECSAAGAVPVTTDKGALLQTTGDGRRVVGPPTGDFAKQVAKRTLEIYGDQDVMRSAIEHSWRYSSVAIGNQWEGLIYTLMEQKAASSRREVLPLGPQNYRPLPTGDVLSTRE